MLKKKTHIFACILIFVLVFAGCSEKSREEIKPPEKNGLPKIEFNGDTMIFNGKEYKRDPRLTVPHDKWIGKGVGLIYDTSVVYEIKGLPTDQWLMASFEKDSLVYRNESLGSFDLTDFSPYAVEVLHEDNTNPSEPGLIPGGTTMSRKIIDKLISTVTEQDPVPLDPYKKMKTEKYLHLKSSRYPMLEYHLTYKEDELGNIYIEDRVELLKPKAYKLTFDDPAVKKAWKDFLKW